jgi:phosphoglycolate phosphatase
MLKGMIVDLDETLISAKPAHESALKDALERNGYSKRLEWVYGLVVEDLIRYNFPKMPDEDIVKVADMKKKKLKNYSALIKPIPGAEDFLKFLKSKGLKLCLLTNNSHIEIKHILEQMGWGKYFDGTLGKEDGAPKPSPELVLIALKKLGLEKKEVLYFGDSDADILSAYAAGVRMMLTQIVHPTAKETNKVQFIITSYREAKSKIGEMLE